MALGMKLKQAREAMGLTESDVAESTHMMTQMIREIEAEDYHRFSAPIYGKGFIRLYAKAVGLDPAPLVAEFTAAMSDHADKPSKPPHVALEAIDKHNETGISIVSPEVPEASGDQPAPPAPPAPTPRHVYAKATVVTMPNTDSPHPMPEPARPAPKPAPATTPVQSAPPAAGHGAEPPARQPAVETAPTTPGDGFKLEAVPAVSVAPQPVAAPVRPFQYPVPRQPARPAPAPVRARDEEEDDEAQPVEKPVRPRPPRRNRQRPSFGLATALRDWADKARESIAALREKPEASEEDEGGPLGDAAPRHRRYWIGGIAAAVVALAVLLLSNRGGEAPGGATVAETPAAIDAGVEPIVAGADAPPVEPVEAISEPAIPATPTEIVRVLPPPKCFAR